MSWLDIGALKDRVATALSSYDWRTAQQLIDQVIRKTHEERSPCPADAAAAMLDALRGKRRFELITRAAEAFVFSGQTAPPIRRHYAQALIDSGLLLAAEPILLALAGETLEGDSQVVEAHGLLGRLYKQRFVNADRPDHPYARAAFERALAEYLQTYRINPLKNYWHGVNVVALLHRAKADRIPIVHAPDAAALAQDVLETLRNSGADDPFALATKAEALVALGEYRDAEDALLEYSRHPETDAFKATSTLRQFEEVWRLRDDTPPGSTLVPILRAAAVRGENGALITAAANVDREIEKVKEAQTKLESNFGVDKTVTLKWYLTGLERTKSVARVERLDGRGHGTGWLVRAEDFFADRTGLLLLTNAHVVDATGAGGALTPGQARANFQGLDTTFELADTIVWSSPATRLDATFLAFKNAVPAAAPMPIASQAVELDVPPQRVYIMGHPDGRDLEFSLHDNKLVDIAQSFLRYRTPTEHGSSGSPVFEHLGWQVVALHHAGEPSPGADGKKPAYEANEGIAMSALRTATGR
jgi:hypothetical protein